MSSRLVTQTGGVLLLFLPAHDAHWRFARLPADARHTHTHTHKETHMSSHLEVGILLTGEFNINAGWMIG